MTTYYNDVLRKLDANFLDVNPARDHLILSKYGHMDLTDVAINQKYVQMEVILKKTKTLWQDYLAFIGGESTLAPLIHKAKFLVGGVNVSEEDLRALEGGHSATAQRIKGEIQTAESSMNVKLAAVCQGYVTANTGIDGDTDWIYPLKAKAATGTATDPEDICTTAGTVQDYTAHLMTGSNKTSNFVNSTFGNSIEQFMAQRDSTTGETMMHFDGTDSFTCFMHPTAIKDLSTFHPTNGTFDLSVTYLDEITKIGVELVPSWEVDASYGSAEDGTVPYIMCLNMQENFKIGYVQPYTVDPWVKIMKDNVLTYNKRLWMKVIAFAVPYYINSTWAKAMHAANFTYMNDAG